MGYIGLALAGIVAVAGAAARLHRVRVMERSQALSDDQIRAIERAGTLQLDEDEPLDLSEARAEEERFWREERWDEGDEW